MTSFVHHHHHHQQQQQPTDVSFSHRSQEAWVSYTVVS